MNAVKNAGFLTVFALLLVISAALVPALSAADGGEVTGVIVDAKTGAPIEGAEVRLTPAYWLVDYAEAGQAVTDVYFEGYVAVTDSSGTFTLQVPEGEYEATVIADGYERGFSFVSVYGDATFTLSLYAVPPTDATILVTVTDETTGEPIEWANVYLWPNYSWDEVGILGFPSYMEVYGYTDAQGVFGSGIWAGKYTLSVDAKGHEPYWADVSVISGEDAKVAVDLVPYPVPDSRIEGFVYDFETGEPLANCSVSAYPDYCRCYCDSVYWEPQYATTDATGFYALPAVAGSVQLTFWADGYEYYWMQVNTPSNTTMRVDASLVPIFVPELVATLSGTVSSSDGPVGNAYIEVWMYSDPYAKVAPAIGIEDDRYAGDWYGQSFYYWGYTDADGMYSVELPAGEASITVNAPGFYAQYSYMTIAAGDNSLDALLEAMPEPDAAIEGAVVDEDGLPVEGAYVYAYSFTDPFILYEENADRFSEDADIGIAVSSDAVSGGYYDPYGYFYADAVTDSSGSFSLAVSGGSYSLDVWAEGYEYFSTIVTVEAKGTLTITVSLTEGENGNRTQLLTPLKVIDSDTGSAPSGSGGSFYVGSSDTVYIYLDDHFTDADGDELTFTYAAPDGFDVTYDEAQNRLAVRMPDGYEGPGVVTVSASDGKSSVTETFVMGVEDGFSFPLWPLLGFIAAIVVSAGVLVVLYVAQRE